MGQSKKEFHKGLEEDESAEGPCPFCGAEVTDTAKFCPGCGKTAEEIITAKRVPSA